MKLDEVLQQGSDVLGVRRVFGEPFEKNGVTVIPAARLMGGAGGADSSEAAETDPAKAGAARGQGAGYGLVAGPAGAFVIRGDKVASMPAIDVNRLMFGFQVVLVVFFLMVRSVGKARAKAFETAAKAG